MMAVRSVDVRSSFKEWCSKVFNGETVIISRPKNENVVMLSESEYNNLLKLKRNEAYLDMLKNSVAQAEKGGFVVKSLSDLENME